jgi:hypothetical protein
MTMVIYLQITTLFCIDRKITSQLLNVCGVNDIRQNELSSSEDEIATEKLKMCKPPCIDQISADLMQTGGKTLRSTNCHAIGKIRKKTGGFRIE